MTAFEPGHQKRRARKPADRNLVGAIATIMRGESISTITDWGAGEGRYVRALRAEGFDTKGYDATSGIAAMTDDMVIQWDLTIRSYIPASHGGICIEVGEHIAPELTDAFIDNLCGNTKRILIVSWATPGQRGRGHINCLPPEYVVHRFARRPWWLDEPLTTQVRRLAGKGWDRKLLVFRRCISNS